MVDVGPVPDRLEQRVGKAQGQEVLDRFLAEIMIDPVDLRASSKTAPTSSLMRMAEARSWPMGFSSTTRACGVTMPAAPAPAQIGPNSSGEVAR
jgi:hypothetical protein